MEKQLRAFLNGYAKNDFSQLEQYLTLNTKRISMWSLTEIVGKKNLMNYFQGKAESFKRTNYNPKCYLVKLINVHPEKLAGLMVPNSGEESVLIEMDIDENGLIENIYNNVAGLYLFEILENIK